MPNQPNQPLPGKGLFGWLGRQVGYVSGAVKAKPGAATPKPAAAPTDGPRTPPTVIYRDDKVEEAPHPTRPGVKLRRTIIDEVVVERSDDPPDDRDAR
jgi:hypothetical protein